MIIIMNSPALAVTEIKKRTKAKLFKDLKVGDKIQLSIPVRAVYGIAASIEIWKLGTDEKVYKTFNEIGSILACFEFEEV